MSLNNSQQAMTLATAAPVHITKSQQSIEQVCSSGILSKCCSDKHFAYNNTAQVHSLTYSGT